MTSLSERWQKLCYGEQDRAENRRRAGILEVAPEAILPSDLIPSDPSVVWGIDWSGYWNGIPNLNIFKAMGGKFCIIKIADGTSPTMYWRENVLNSQALGLVTGGYFWLYRNARISGGSQARAWWNLVKDLNLDLHVIDYEWTFWAGKQDNPTEADLLGAAEPFEQLSGQAMWIYSAPSYLSENPLHSSARRLFIAHYGTMTPMTTPPWTAGAYTLHQRSEKWDAVSLGFDANVTNAADGDIFHGTLDQFDDLFGVSDPDPVVFHVLKYKLSEVEIFLTPSASDILPLKTPLQQAQENGWEAAMNCGAGFVYTDATHAQINTAGFEFITLDNGQKAYYSRRMITKGVLNSDQDSSYLAPWSMLGLDGTYLYLIVTEGQEAVSGWTQSEAAQYWKAQGIIDLYLFDSGHSSGIANGTAMIYSAYNEAIPQCIGIRRKTGGIMTKGLAKAGTSSNIKRMDNSVILASLKGGDSVYGTLSSQKTDIINFDHFYRADGARWELGAMCKVTVSNLTLNEEAEPGTPPPPPPPPPQNLPFYATVFIEKDDGTLLKPTGITPDGKVKME